MLMISVTCTEKTWSLSKTIWWDFSYTFPCFLLMKYLENMRKPVKKHGWPTPLICLSLCIWYVDMWQGPCVWMSICLHPVQQVVPSHGAKVAALKNETVIFFSSRIILRKALSFMLANLANFFHTYYFTHCRYKFIDKISLQHLCIMSLVWSPRNQMDSSGRLQASLCEWSDCSKPKGSICMLTQEPVKPFRLLFNNVGGA